VLVVLLMFTPSERSTSPRLIICSDLLMVTNVGYADEWRLVAILFLFEAAERYKLN